MVQDLKDRYAATGARAATFARHQGLPPSVLRCLLLRACACVCLSHRPKLNSFAKGLTCPVWFNCLEHTRL